MAAQNERKILRKRLRTRLSPRIRRRRAGIEVPDASHGLDPVRITLRTTKLFPKITHMNVDTPVERSEVPA
jgi:hypothetical protein